LKRAHQDKVLKYEIAVDGGCHHGDGAG